MARVQAVEWLDVDDEYALVLVVLRKNHVSEVLPMLAANRRTPSIVFFGNNAAGPGEMIRALGRDRVPAGFPGAAAVTHDHTIRYLILSEREQPTTIGELDGTRSRRVEAIAHALETAGFPVAICPNIDAWLKSHVAEIGPTAGALYMSGVDPGRLAGTRDALVLMLRAIREGYRVLCAHGIPITPRSHQIFQWLPEPLLLIVMKRMIASETMSIKIGHALGARDEMKALAEDFRALAATTSIATPAMDRLYEYLDPSARPIEERSASIALQWGGVWLLGVALVLFLVLLSMFWRGTA